MTDDELNDVFEPEGPGLKEEARQPNLSTAAFKRFAAHISETLGIQLNDSKRPLLEARLMRRARELGLPDVRAYHDYFFSERGLRTEPLVLSNYVTTNKTDFFREPAHFQYFTQRIVPEWVAHRGAVQPFNVWSAGCSSGEEPYSIAMSLAELARAQPSFEFQVFATDISHRMLDLAVDGIYPAARVAGMDPGMRSRYLMRSREPGRDLVRVVPELRSRIRFAWINLMEAPYAVPGPFDCIFFRNVMIYFSRSLQIEVVNALCQSLRSGGYFLPGHTESLHGMAVPLEAIAPAIYKKL